MQRVRHILVGCLLVLGSIPPTISAKTLQIVNSAGEKTEMEIQATDTFLDILAWVDSYLQEEGNVSLKASCLDFTVSPVNMIVRAKKAYRDYNISVTKEEKKTLADIVNTLANEPEWSIALSFFDIEEKGEKLQHLHPLRFVMTLFTDEKLKAGVHAIRDRGGMIWGRFLGGITGSLTDEAANHNLNETQIKDFARKVKIDVNLILPALQQECWEDFVDILIDKLPRENNPNRYNM